MGEILAFLAFLAKNDGEKWYRKNIFGIPPCAHHVILITEFVLLTKTAPFYEVNSYFILTWDSMVGFVIFCVLNASRNSYKKYKNYSKLPNRYKASQILRFSFI